MEYIYILGVKVYKIKKGDILGKIKEWLCDDKFYYITTVNPEFVLAAEKDKEFRAILNDSDLAIPDGIGLKFASWIFGKNIYRTAGADLFKDILELAAHKNYKVYFFVWKQGLSGIDEVKKAISHSILNHSLKNGGIQIDGQAIEKDGSDINWNKISEFNPDILFVGLGAPYQEKIIAKIRSGEIGSTNLVLRRGGVKVAMGVGTSFDFLCGKVKRAPKFMRFLGLEWLYRVAQLPKPPYNYFYRIKRIFNAILVFPWHVLVWRMRIIFYGNQKR